MSYNNVRVVFKNKVEPEKKKMVKSFVKETYKKFTNAIENKIKLETFNDNLKKNINALTLSKLKRYYPYNSENSEIIEYCKDKFSVDNINDNISLKTFKEIIIESYKNIIKSKNKIASNIILEDFENKIEESLNWCKEIYILLEPSQPESILNKYENITTNENIKKILNIKKNEILEKQIIKFENKKGLSINFYLDILKVYIKLTASLKKIIPDLISIRNEKYPPSNGCGVGCSISGGKSKK